MLHPRTPRCAGLLEAGLLEDGRLCSVAEQLYGPDFIGICTDANRYYESTHCSRYGPEPGAMWRVTQESCWSVAREV